MILISLTMIFGTLPSAVFAESEQTTDTGVSEEAQEMVESGDIAEDQVIVVFEEGVSASKAKAICEDNDVDVQKVTTLDGQKAVLAETDDDQSVAEAITEIDKERKVAYVQPNYRYTVDKADPFNNDTSQGQWYLKNIKAREAAKELAGITGSKVKVAVIDTGADVSHEDLNINKNLSVQLDHKGGTKPLLDDQDQHGTHVAGIIGATYDNGKGIAGVASLSGNKIADLFVVDAFTAGGFGGWFDSFDLVAAVKYVTDKGAKVFNMSIGGYGRDRYLESAFEYAYRNDVVAVVAAGNEGAEVVETPADFGSVISVCATTKENKRAYYSSIGLPKDISAPGTSILSTIPGDEYAKMSGTSMASPVVAGAAAAVRYANPALKAAQVKNILCATADPSIGDNATGFDKKTGYGLLDMDAAVKAAESASASIEPESIAVKPGAKDVLLSRQDTYRIETIVLPATSLAEVTFESSDESVASVDETGLVTAEATGSAVITAKAGDKSCEVNVYVDSSDVPETVTITDPGERVYGSEMTIPSYESVTKTYYPTIYLNGLVAPASAVNKDELAWESSNLKVVTVDEYGMLTGHDPGDAVVTVTTYNGKTDSITVHVRNVATSVKFTSKIKKIKKGNTFTFKAEARPSNAADKKIYWKSSNRKTASIDNTTGKFTAKNAGKTTITAYTKYGAQIRIRVTVTKADTKAKTGAKTKVSSGIFAMGDGPGEARERSEVVRAMIPEKAKAGLDKLRHGSDGKKGAKSAACDQLEVLRQQIVEEGDEMLGYVLASESRYCKPVWNEIMQSYDAFVEKVNTIRSFDELMTYAETYMAKVGRTAALTKDQVKTGSAAELKKFKESKIKLLKEAYNKKKKEGAFNAYYSDRLEDSYYIGKKNINAATSFGVAAAGYSTARKYITGCKTKKAFAKYRKQAKKISKDSLIKPLVKSDYTSKEWSLINSIFNEEMTKIDKARNVGEILEIEDGLFGLIFHSLPANEHYSDSLYAKSVRMLDDAFDSYDENDYSSDGYEKLCNVYYSALEAMEHALTNDAEKARANDGIAKMKKVPDYAKELKALKKKLKTKLDKYKGNKKYVQKKVRPIVKKGKAAIDKCKTIEKANQVFQNYKNKAEATIKKFRIKSSAGKGGTITASKTVKYGSNAVFEIKASKGYKIKELKVDGKKVKIVKKYTFKKVKKNHTIKVKFKEKKK